MAHATARIGPGALVLTLVVVLWSPAATAARLAREVDHHDMDDVQAEVFMRVRATPAQVKTVRREIAQSPLVKQFGFLDKEDAYREFSRAFADDPDLVADADPQSLPTSFRVDLRVSSDRARFKKRVERLAGVDEVVLRYTPEERAFMEIMDEQRNKEIEARCGPGPPIEVFMEVKANAAEEAAVDAALHAMPEVVSVHKVTRAEAKQTFDCIFADTPALTKNVDASSLPVSFRVDVRPGTDFTGQVRSLERMLGVDRVLIDR